MNRPTPVPIPTLGAAGDDLRGQRIAGDTMRSRSKPDPLRAARGVVTAFALAVPFWAIAAAGYLFLAG